MEPDSEMFRLQVLGDPRLMEELRQSQPELVSAVNDPVRFRHVFALLEQQRREAERAKQLEIVRSPEYIEWVHRGGLIGGIIYRHASTRTHSTPNRKLGLQS